MHPSRQKSRSFSVVSCNLRVSFWLQRSTVRQIEHLKPWSARPSPSVLDQRTNKNPTALMLQEPQGLAVWLASCCWKAFLLRKRWLFVRSFNVSKFGSNALSLTALKSRQRKQGNSVQGAVWDVLGSLSICNLQDLCPAREFSDWNTRFVSCG